MPVIVLVFVNYTHFSRKYRNYASNFHFKISKNTSKTMHMQQTSTRQKQLPYLHHCVHVWSAGHDGCHNKQTKIDFVT